MAKKMKEYDDLKRNLKEKNKQKILLKYFNARKNTEK